MKQFVKSTLAVVALATFTSQAVSAQSQTSNVNSRERILQVLDQRQVLLSLLPAEYTVQNLVTEAKSQGLSYRTATRWNEEWQGKGLVQKIRHGVYKKRLASA